MFIEIHAVLYPVPLDIEAAGGERIAEFAASLTAASNATIPIQEPSEPDQQFAGTSIGA